MTKIKFFWNGLDTSVQTWLYENPHIDIISTNFACNSLGWGYVILYKEGEAHE
jgi:hypothetical protein